MGQASVPAMRHTDAMEPLHPGTVLLVYDRGLLLPLYAGAA